MCPIEFNLGVKFVALDSKDRVSPTSSVKNTEKLHNVTSTKDSFVKSELLNTLQNIASDYQVITSQSQKIDELKKKISNKDLPILSDDKNVRLLAARNVAEKWLSFEQQLQFDTVTSDE